jgi:hypothetical protein
MWNTDLCMLCLRNFGLYPVWETVDLLWIGQGHPWYNSHLIEDQVLAPILLYRLYERSWPSRGNHLIDFSNIVHAPDLRASGVVCILMPASKEGEILSLWFSYGHLHFVSIRARLEQVALKDCKVHLTKTKSIPQADLSVVLVLCAMFFTYRCTFSEGCLHWAFVVFFFFLAGPNRSARYCFTHTVMIHLTPHLQILRVCPTWRHRGHYGVQSYTVWWNSNMLRIFLIQFLHRHTIVLQNLDIIESFHTD